MYTKYTNALTKCTPREVQRHTQQKINTPVVRINSIFIFLTTGVNVNVVKIFDRRGSVKSSLTIQINQFSYYVLIWVIFDSVFKSKLCLYLKALILVWKNVMIGGRYRLLRLSCLNPIKFHLIKNLNSDT